MLLGCAERVIEGRHFSSFHDAVEELWAAQEACWEGENEAARQTIKQNWWRSFDYIAGLGETEPQCIDIWMDFADCVADHRDEIVDPCNALPPSCLDEYMATDGHPECNCPYC